MPRARPTRDAEDQPEEGATPRCCSCSASKHVRHHQIRVRSARESARSPHPAATGCLWNTASTEKDETTTAGAVTRAASVRCGARDRCASGQVQSTIVKRRVVKTTARRRKIILKASIFYDHHKRGEEGQRRRDRTATVCDRECAYSTAIDWPMGCIEWIYTHVPTGCSLKKNK